MDSSRGTAAESVAGKCVAEHLSSWRHLVAVEANGWESEFFGRKTGKIVVDPALLAPGNPNRLRTSLVNLIGSASAEGYQLLELDFPASAWHGILVAEDLGFRLVDSRLTFISPVRRGITPSFRCTEGKPDLASKDDVAEILVLTHLAFTRNPAFYSRFKNREFYSEEQTERYYTAWIENHLDDPDTLFAVLRSRDRIGGYLIYRSDGSWEGKPYFKGVLAAVAGGLRGKKVFPALATFLSEKIKSNVFWLNSTTQMSNVSAINSYVRLQRSLQSTELIYYRAL